MYQRRAAARRLIAPRGDAVGGHVAENLRERHPRCGIWGRTAPPEFGPETFGPLVNLALAAGARCLVTWDNDLLDLMQGGNADGGRLKALAPDLTVLTPPELMRLLRTAQGAEHAEPEAEP